jgi:hypothetical protein
LKLKEELIKIVGAENFFDDPEILKHYSKDYSLLSPRMPAYLVKPKNGDEIQKVVRLANESKMPIVPCSSGTHFFGATIPNQGGIVIDLSRMNKILQIDERNRKVMIEPGVTWGQLQEALNKYNLMALNPLLPHASKSALSSSLEREPILIPKFEYSEPIINMEVVLPTGEIFRTGAASAPDSLAPDANTSLCGPWGPGLDIVRVFQGAQGTLGIVTWMNVKTEYLPKAQKIFFVPFKKIQDAIEPIYRIQRLVIGNECFLLNNFNLANILTEKWPGDFEVLRETLPPFTLVLVLAGGKRLSMEKIAYEEEALMKAASQLSIEVLPRLPNAPHIEKTILEKLKLPWPDDEEYWKLRYKGSCQDIFFFTTLDKIPEITRLIHQIAAKYEYAGKDIGFYLQPVERARIAHCEFNFFYDPDDSREMKNMHNLYVDAVESLTNMGAFFARPYPIAADIIYCRAAAYTAALKKVRSILDPNNIMNPGKLCF